MARSMRIPRSASGRELGGRAGGPHTHESTSASCSRRMPASSAVGSPCMSRPCMSSRACAACTIASLKHRCASCASGGVSGRPGNSRRSHAPPPMASSQVLSRSLPQPTAASVATSRGSARPRGSPGRGSSSARAEAERACARWLSHPPGGSPSPANAPRTSSGAVSARARLPRVAAARPARHAGDPTRRDARGMLGRYPARLSA
jgi:hypothetical protein